MIRGCALALLFSIAAASAARKPIPWEKSYQQIGQALYRENCVVCHDIDRPQSKKSGPSFYRLFERAQMPIAKMKPNREYIKLRIKFGGPLMPAFQKYLTDRDIETLIDYIAFSATSPRSTARPNP